jgi:hypothetical protein
MPLGFIALPLCRRPVLIGTEDTFALMPKLGGKCTITDTLIWKYKTLDAQFLQVTLALPVGPEIFRVC